MIASQPPKQSSRVNFYAFMISAIILALLVTYSWFVLVGVTTTGRIELSVLSFLFVAGCDALFYSVVSRKFNRPMTRVVVICWSALLWHLIWLFTFGSPGAVTGWVIEFNAIPGSEEPQGNVAWFAQFAPYYFELLPLTLLAFALIFGWRGMPFAKRHPITFLVTILAAISPTAFVAYVYYSAKSYL